MNTPARIHTLFSHEDADKLGSFARHLANSKRKAATTIETYLHHIATLADFVGGGRQVALTDLLKKRTFWEAIDRIPPERASTRRNIVKAIRQLATFLENYEELEEDQIAWVRKPLKLPFSDKPKRPLLKADLVEPTLLAIVDSPAYTHEYDRILDLALFATYLLTGLRATELCEVSSGDLAVALQTLDVRNGKGGKARRVGVPDRLRGLLDLYDSVRPAASVDRYFVTRAGQPLTRYTVGNRFKRMSKASGITLSPHRLRRSFATHNINRGVPITDVQQMMGHTDIATTMIYVQIDQSEVVDRMKTW